MGTGQMLITIAAIVLLGTIIVNTNVGIGKSTQLLLETNFGLESVSLCASTIEEADNLPFDSSTVTPSKLDSSTTELTPPSSLGQANYGDSLKDFDDYNGNDAAHGGKGYRLDSMQLGTGWYKRWTQVQYVNFGTLSVNTTSPTWIKRLDVKVWNVADSINSVVSMYSFDTYWFFR